MVKDCLLGLRPGSMLLIISVGVKRIDSPAGLASVSQIVYVPFAGMVLIWNTAPGSSVDSAWTVALIPSAARAPRTMPHGNHRNCLSMISFVSSNLCLPVYHRLTWCHYQNQPRIKTNIPVVPLEQPVHPSRHSSSRMA